MLRKKQAIEGRIKRVSTEIEEIESYFYGGTREDIETRLYLLQLKRENVIRSIVLELHLALEDLITSWLKSYLLNCRPRSLDRALRRRTILTRNVDDFLGGDAPIGFAKKLSLARLTGFVGGATYSKLRDLNKLRNRCSHNWLLNIVIRRGVKRRKSKKHLLEFRGLNLYEVGPFKEFTREFASLYYKLFSRLYA